MNNLLRKVARELRYRPTPELIGLAVTIENVKGIPNAVGAAVNSLPFGLRFIGPQEPWLTTALAKYCHLDLTFAVDEIEWQPGDCLGISTLKELGFALHPDDLPEDQRESIEQNNDPTCINELAEGINQGQSVLRLFLEEVPRREPLEYWKEMMRAGNGRRFFGGVDELKLLLADFFPHRMTITDACLTNAQFIWFHKHFYL